MSAGGLYTQRLARVHNVMSRYVERGEVPAGGLVSTAATRGALGSDLGYRLKQAVENALNQLPERCSFLG